MMNWLPNDMEIFIFHGRQILLLVAIAYILFIGAFLYGLWMFKKQDTRLYPKDGSMISEEKTKQLIEVVGVRVSGKPKIPTRQLTPLDGKRISRAETLKLLREIGIRGKRRD